MSNFADEIAINPVARERVWPEADMYFVAPPYTEARLAELRRIHNIPDEPPF